jgi:hypothetical protein
MYLSRVKSDRTIVYSFPHTVHGQKHNHVALHTAPARTHRAVMDTLTTCSPIDPRNAKPTALPRAATAYVASDLKTLAYSAPPNATPTLGATQNNHSCPRAVANWRRDVSKIKELSFLPVLIPLFARDALTLETKAEWVTRWNGYLNL